MKENGQKRLAILGATGSIGLQTLDIVRQHPELYRAEVLSAGRRVEELIALCREFRPRLAVIGRRELEPRLREALAPLGIRVASGPEALCEAAEAPDVDMVVTATVGYSGLEPTVRAIRAGKEIALANKETLVVAGEYIRRLMAEHPEAKIYPVDSEHSAVAQCLAGETPESVRRLIITASGGPFRTWDAARIAKATAADALKHPNWNMGAKITIDSATMMNKAFELIEAHYLFDIPADRIEAVVHPQSIIHSMVEFKDGAIKAQLGVPDMRLPIAYALGRSTRLGGVSEALTLEKMANLTFEAPDEAKFPCLGLARLCLERKGTTACTVNGANEIAVAAFLEGRIAFGDIFRTIAGTLERASFIAEPTFEDYVASNAESRRIAAEEIGRRGI
ncbi:MAG: 1-deoxy-D-xylulose-5-phosphate reductoisomerase [Muribaculaceae bacterium]|nr:1-deoxy-D-xylulose-5-phosphate reductoisomerase [Muribaculaceae bacterium]